MNKVSVIILAKNRTKDMIRCFESITFQTVLKDREYCEDKGLQMHKQRFKKIINRRIL